MDITAVEKQTNIAMLVEDQSLQDYMARLLTGANFKVKAYNTQDQALSGIEEDNPELIICDFKHSRTNGADFCKALRKNPKFLHTPVIFILRIFPIKQKLSMPAETTTSTAIPWKKSSWLKYSFACTAYQGSKT